MCTYYEENINERNSGVDGKHPDENIISRKFQELCEVENWITALKV